jgi:aromatic-L-amino-acid decarboxylase
MNPRPRDWPEPVLDFEPSPEQMHALLERAGARLVEHVGSLASQPAADVEGVAVLARALARPAPEGPGDFDALLGLLFDEVIPKSYNAAGPGYLAYVPGGGLFVSALAQLIAAGVNRYTALWGPAPLMVQLETNVVRWLCDLVGLPTTASGVLVSGGSLANFSALVTARRTRLGDAFQDGVLYCSDQVHHSVAKAAALAGFAPRQVRRLASDAHQRLPVAALRACVQADRAAGLRPFLVVASAGTTNTGAIDELEALADLCAAEQLWLHVDAAYGGFFVLTERGRELLRGLERADSLSLDPHKGLFLPFGTGCLLVRDAALLRQAHGVQADYLPAPADVSEFADFADLGPELTRPYRGLGVWLPIELYGWGAFRRALDEKLDLAAQAAEALRAWPEIELLAEPSLSIVAFRLRTPGLDGPAADAANRAWLARVNARGRVFLSGTLLDGRFVLRLCVLSFRTHAERVQQALADLRATLPGAVPG